VARLHELCGDKFVSAGPPLALGLFRSVALVVCLKRKNVTQDFAGAVFGVSQATVSRRWDLLRPPRGARAATCLPSAGLRPVLPQGPPAPGMVLHCLRQPSPHRQLLPPPPTRNGHRFIEPLTVA
jgi:hypothetical protein